MTRDEKGRFIKGHEKIGGRKSRDEENNFMALIDTAVSNDDWLAIIRTAKRQAIKGDANARTWLTDRRFGKAPDRHEISGADGEAIQVRYVNTPYPVTDVPSGASGDTSGTEEI